MLISIIRNRQKTQKVQGNQIKNEIKTNTTESNMFRNVGNIDSLSII